SRNEEAADAEEAGYRPTPEPDASDRRIGPEASDRPRVRDDDERGEHESQGVEAVVAGVELGRERARCAVCARPRLRRTHRRVGSCTGHRLARSWIVTTPPGRP